MADTGVRGQERDLGGEDGELTDDPTVTSSEGDLEADEASAGSAAAATADREDVVADGPPSFEDPSER